MTHPLHRQFSHQGPRRGDIVGVMSHHASDVARENHNYISVSSDIK